MSVIDASTVVRLVLRLPRADQAERHVFDPAERQAAPDLLNAEVLHVIRALERRAEVDAKRSASAVGTLGRLPIARYPTFTLLERAWALRHNFTAYDSMYVALAEALRTRLVTTDERLAIATRTHTGVEVVLLA